MPQHADHDRYFKKLLEVFFDEFLEAFFPVLYASLDLSAKKFLSQELFPDIIKGIKKRADLIVETKLREKTEHPILLIHVETQSYHQKSFPERMCIYGMMIYLIYQKPVFPIAVFSYDKDMNEPTTFSFGTPFFTTMTFCFQTLELHKLNWRTFMSSTNPVAAALMCKMHYTKEERVAVRLAFLRSLAHMVLDDARKSMLNGFFEHYLQLDEREEERFMQEVHKLPENERDDVLKWPNSFYDRGVEQGIKQGMKQGKASATREIAAGLLKEKMSVAKIAEITGLSMDEIESLKDK